MAQQKITITVDSKNVNDGMLYKTEFADQMSSIESGDKFWIPNADLLVVFGTAVNPGTPQARALGERMYVVRLDKDNNPTEVSQLFLSQMARKDGKTNKYVFPENDLSIAHRLGVRYFKKTVAEHIVSVGDEKMHNARVWGGDAWVKEGDGFKTIEKPTFEFNLTSDTLSKENLNKAIELLVELYETIPSITVNKTTVDEE